MVRWWMILLVLWGVVYAQTPLSSVPMLPASRLGLSVTQENGATTFRKDGLSFTYVEGLGWIPPLEAGLPPPQGAMLPVEVVRAVGLVAAPEAGCVPLPALTACVWYSICLRVTWCSPRPPAWPRIQAAWS